MATKYPLILNDIMFYVNPMSLKLSKSTAISSLPMQSGVKFYSWYDNPETLSISGICAEDSAYKELLFLKENFENTNKLSTLFYKTTVYQGIIVSLDVNFDHDNPNRFPYSISFQLLYGQKFRVEDFSLQSDPVSSALSGLADKVNVIVSDSEKWVKDRLGIK